MFVEYFATDRRLAPPKLGQKLECKQLVIQVKYKYKFLKGQCFVRCFF